jgi:hypothetical protein
MQNFKTYDVASNEILMAIIINRAAGIKDDFWRGYTQNLVAEIKAAAPRQISTKGTAAGGL